MKMIKVICDFCNKEFEYLDYYYYYKKNKMKQRVFCSRECANNAHSKLMSINNPSMKPECARNVSIGVSEWHKRIKGTDKEFEIGRKISEANRIITKRNCLYCNKEMILDYKTRKRMFCSYKCSNSYHNKSDTMRIASSNNMRLKHELGVVRHPNLLVANRGLRKSTELPIFEMLKSLGFSPIHNHNIGKYWVDFFIEPNICIECDGTYWHRNTKDADNEKDKTLISKGFKVIRFSENEIKEIELCKQKLLSVLNQ